MNPHPSILNKSILELKRIEERNKHKMPIGLGAELLRSAVNPELLKPNPRISGLLDTDGLWEIPGSWLNVAGSM